MYLEATRQPTTAHGSSFHRQLKLYHPSNAIPPILQHVWCAGTTHFDFESKWLTRIMVASTENIHNILNFKSNIAVSYHLFVPLECSVCNVLRICNICVWYELTYTYMLQVARKIESLACVAKTYDGLIWYDAIRWLYHII